jgi:hypothetical protein
MVIADSQFNPEAAVGLLGVLPDTRAFGGCIGSRIRSRCRTLVRNPEGAYARLPKNLSAGDPGKKGRTWSAFT